jgi:hypothetical protein
MWCEPVTFASGLGKTHTQFDLYSIAVYRLGSIKAFQLSVSNALSFAGIPTLVRYILSKSGINLSLNQGFT